MEIWYENKDQNLNMSLMINNSKVAIPSGKKNLILSNGSQTWEQGDQNFSAIFWSYKNLNYTLISGRYVSGNPEPLYDYTKLIEIANTIK